MRQIHDNTGGNAAHIYTATARKLDLTARRPQASFYRRSNRLRQDGFATWTNQAGWQTTSRGELLLRLLDGEWEFAKEATSRTTRVGIVHERSITGTDLHILVH